MFIMMKECEKKVRLDLYLCEQFPEFSRSHFRHMIDRGDVKVNDRVVKAGHWLKLGDLVEINEPKLEPTDILPERTRLDIIYQDDDLLVINKPQGMVVHPTSSLRSGTLVNALLYNVKDLSGINGELRPGIVHRLDKDTSGLILVAKNDKAHVSLANQIAEKTCKRTYFAIVDGVWKEDEGVIQTQIGRDPKDRKKMAVVRGLNGKKAITYYKTLDRTLKFSFMQFVLGTGRTHQIRVHCKYMHHPIVGDEVYGNAHPEFKLRGQLLHAAYIEFDHPTTGERLKFGAEPPTDFKRVMDKIGTTFTWNLYEEDDDDLEEY